MNKFWFIGLLLILISITGISCNLAQNPSQSVPLGENLNSEETSSSNLATIDPQSLQSKLDEHLNLAASFAQTWQSNALLYGVNIKIGPPLSGADVSETYVFGSLSDPSFWYTVSFVGEQKPVRAAIFKEDYLPGLQKPLKTEFWKTNFVKAFQVAEKSGGQIFRQQNPKFSVHLSLSVSEPKGWLWWMVEYKSEGKETLQFKIDPDDGSLVNEQGEKI